MIDTELARRQAEADIEKRYAELVRDAENAGLDLSQIVRPGEGGVS